jgi:hypothetical protein
MFGRGKKSHPEFSALAKHLRRSYICDDPLHMFRRLDITGLAYKGQLSSGYAQAGFGGSFSASFDLGTLIAPGLIRIPITGKVAAKRTDHHLLVIARMPKALYDKTVSKLRLPSARRNQAQPPPQNDVGKTLRPYAVDGIGKNNIVRPFWAGEKPLSLAMMDGSTYQMSFNAGIGIEIGIGDPFAADEAGLALGAKVEGTVELEISDLVEKSGSRAFKPAVDSNDPRDAVDEILADGLKEQLVLWMIVADPDWRKSIDERTLSAGLADLVKMANTTWAGLQHDWPIDADVVGPLQKLFSALVPNRRPSTKKLEELLENFKAGLEATDTRASQELAKLRRWFEQIALLVDARKLDDDQRMSLQLWLDSQQTELNDLMSEFRWTYDPKKALRDEIEAIFTAPPAGKTPIAALNDVLRSIAAAEKRRARMDQTRHAVNKRNLDFVTEFKQRLEKRKAAKNDGPIEPEPPQQNAGPSLMRVNSAISLKAVAGIAFKAQLPKTIAGEEASFISDYTCKHVKFRLQVGGEKTQANKRQPAGHVVLTQDTNVVQNLLSLRAGISGSVRRQGATKNPNVDNDVEVADRNWRYGTVSYRTVSTYWFHPSNAHIGDQPLAYPNGSGVTFGLSVEPGRIGRYAQNCRDRKPGETSHEQELETLLRAQLRVDTETLRAFFADFPFPTKTTSTKKHLDESGYDFERAFIIEAGFGFTKTVKMPKLMKLNTTGINEPDWLFDQAEAKERLDSKEPGELSASTLRVLRVRYPIVTENDNSHSVFCFGWTGTANEPPSADSLLEPKPDQLANLKAGHAPVTGTAGIGIDRIKRVGNEGLIDLHIQTFPGLLEDHDWTERQQWRRTRAFDLVHEFVVPPTALLGHGR